MDLSEIPVFKAINRKMGWLAKRQEVIAQNVAHSDTPGYRPRDLKEMSFEHLVGQPRRTGEMTLTNGRHMTGQTRDVSHRREEDRDPYEIAPAGNAVVLEEQLMAATKTAMDYQMLTNLYRKHVGMVRTALGRSGQG